MGTAGVAPHTGEEPCRCTGAQVGGVCACAGRAVSAPPASNSNARITRPGRAHLTRTEHLDTARLGEKRDARRLSRQSAALSIAAGIPFLKSQRYGTHAEQLMQ